MSFSYSSRPLEITENTFLYPEDELPSVVAGRQQPEVIYQQFREAGLTELEEAARDNPVGLASAILGGKSVFENYSNLVVVGLVADAADQGGLRFEGVWHNSSNSLRMNNGTHRTDYDTSAINTQLAKQWLGYANKQEISPEVATQCALGRIAKIGYHDWKQRETLRADAMQVIVGRAGLRQVVEAASALSGILSYGKYES